MPTSPVPQLVEGFLKELLGAKKAVKLYPAGNPLAAEWIQRLHRTLESAFQEGFPPSLRIANGRWEWDGGHLATRDQALETFRFELETRHINEIAIEPGVEPWELRDLLDCLSLGQQEMHAAGGPQAVLTQKNVVHITLRGLLWGEGEGTAAPGMATTRFDLLDGLVTAILEALADQFRELTYDRKRLAPWLLALGEPGGRAESVFAGIEMLIPLIDEEPDRELRYRILAESIVSLPDPLRSTLVGTWLMPRAWIPDVLNLLTRFSGDELAELTRVVPASALAEIRANLEEMPADDWRKARFRESLEDALAAKESPAAPQEPVIADDDPGIAKLRDIARAACTPDAVLSHSVNILFHLLGAVETDAYPVFLVDALEEAIAEGLARDELRLALRILRALNNLEKLRPQWIAEHQRRLYLLQKRLSGRSHVSLLADVLRRSEAADDIRGATEYLGLLGHEATEEFVALLADEEDGHARARMLDVLAAIGPAAVPAIRARVADSPWAVSRHMVALLARIGDPTAFQVVEKLVRHEHPQVRREVARALAALGGRQAMKPLLQYLGDPDGEVRLTTIKLLSGLIDADAVGPLREFLTTPTRTVSDLLVKREIITSLASVGSPEARQVLEAIARRRVWPWQQNERKVRQLAKEALATMQLAPPAAPEAPRE